MPSSITVSPRKKTFVYIFTLSFTITLSSIYECLILSKNFHPPQIVFRTFKVSKNTKEIQFSHCKILHKFRQIIYSFPTTKTNEKLTMIKTKKYKTRFSLILYSKLLKFVKKRLRFLTKSYLFFLVVLILKSLPPKFIFKLCFLCISLLKILSLYTS